MPNIRLRPGEVRDAITRVLRLAGEASVADIQKGVEADIGRPVAASSVRSYLNANVDVLFVRVERGSYKLKL
jgi:hypothetical protein